MSILIVDDQKSMRTIIKKTLRHLGIGREIYFADNGQEGLLCLKDRYVDMAIVDWKMPTMNGAQMLDAIRNNPRTRDLPVLMVTGESERDIVYDVAEIEVDAYLLKPLTPAILEEKITQVVEKVNNPDEATVCSKMARDLESRGKIDAAIEWLEKAVDLKPNASRLRRNLGVLYGKQGDMERMEQCLLDAADANLQDAVTRHLLARFYWDREDWNRSVRYECEALTLTNRYNDFAVDVGRELLCNNQNDLAIRLLSKLINKLEKRLLFKENILDMCIELGEMRFAKSLLMRLLEEFPSNHALLFKAGIVHETMGDDEKALEYYLAADKKLVDPIQVKLKIARFYFKKNKVIQADDFISQVLELEPKNPEALELRRAI